MLSNLIKQYHALPDDAKHIVNLTALSPSPPDRKKLRSVAAFRRKVSESRIREIIDESSATGLIYKTSHSEIAISDDYFVVWLYPLLENYEQERKELNKKADYYFYHYAPNEKLLEYLNALLYQRSLLNNAEENLSNTPKERFLSAMFDQPAYASLFKFISGNILQKIYPDYVERVFSNLQPLKQLNRLDHVLDKMSSSHQTRWKIRMAVAEGDFEKAEKFSEGINAPEALMMQATRHFFDNGTDEALTLFEKGLKGQRRDHKGVMIPLSPEMALFYITSWLAKEQDIYRPVFQKIIDSKSNCYPRTFSLFREMCEYSLCNTDRATSIENSLQQIGTRQTEYQALWQIIAFGFTGQQPSTDRFIRKACTLVDKAHSNGYLTMACEAAYALSKWNNMSEYESMYTGLSAKLGYKPALSRITHTEAWEKQLNAFMTLEAVQSLIRKEAGQGKTRVAYRFYPDRNSAQPILQTRQANGAWTTGRNISLGNFIGGKVDCMTGQDKRIALMCSHYSYSLDRKAIFEMVGHPHVLLADSEIPVELVAAQPAIRVVAVPKGGYKIECDVIDMRSEVLIVKETNTRYRIYRIGQHQREIIEAVKKSKTVPEKGRDKLLKVLEHFSVHITIHSDLTVDSDSRARQVEPDSRIRVQLLPLGDGLKAELFVKPFGTCPPYCKPGKGGKTLIANENGERLQVTRDMDREREYEDILLNDIQTIESLETDNNGIMAFGDPLDTLELLDTLNRHPDIAVVEWPEGERFKVRHSAGFENLNLRLTSGIDWFELEGELRLDEETVLSVARLLELVQHGHGRFVELGNGEFLALTRQFKRRLEELGAFSSSDGRKVRINRFASTSLTDTLDDFENLKADKAWRDFRKNLQAVQQTDAVIPALLQAELRPYQETGYRWMMRLSEWGAGACLADDMGLGKTIQAIAVLLQRAVKGPALVVSPVSVMPNWISEVNKFAPSLRVKTLYNGSRAEILASLEAGDLLAISYGLLQSEEKAITDVGWATVVLDEAHSIKNYQTKTSKAAMSLRAGFRITLTGTPLQNHLGEMWNLFHFINPGLLGSLQSFTDRFVKSDDADSRKRLKKLITPFILRRTKTAVLEELPPKTEIIRKIELSSEEMAFYEALRRKAIESITGEDGHQGARHLKALAEITRLRQACCNPAIVEPQVKIASSKMSTFLEIAAELKENGHRALVFSQFVTHLTLVCKELDAAGFSYQYLDGSTTQARRQIAIRNFQNGQGDLFLISLKAGGLGLNLTAADYVIHLDPWWNPAIEDQASDRAHRIGQSRPVTVYRLVAEHTIEEKIIQLHHTKRDLADSLLEGSDRSAKMSIDELVALIKN